MTLPNENAALSRAAMTTEGTRLSGATLLSVGSILASVGAVSCCVVPFALFLAAISGAWIGNLTALKPYQPAFVGVALVCLGAGYYAVYRKPKYVPCAEGSYCARPSSGQNAKIGLWLATVLIVIAVGFPYVARHFLDT